MRFYNKYFENDFEELITYYPRFYLDVYEMVEILKAHGALADDMENNIERVFFNCFVDYADEETIEKFERFLLIGLNKSRTLEERRRLIKAYFVGFGKVSSSMLEEMISSYTGTKVKTTFEPFDENGNNRLDIILQRGNEPTLYMADITGLLAKKVPAHITWRAVVDYVFPSGIGIRRTHYKTDFELAGTKPDLAALGLALEHASVTSARKSSRKTTHEAASEDVQAGELPDIAFLGSYLTIQDVIGAEAKIYTTEHKKAQNGDQEAGIWPEAAQAAAANEISAGAGVRVTGFSVDYNYCGTRYTQS